MRRPPAQRRPSHRAAASAQAAGQPRERWSGRFKPRPKAPSSGLDGTPIPGMNCLECGAPVVRTKTITAEDGSTGTMPGSGYFATPSCECLADCTVPGDVS